MPNFIPEDDIEVAMVQRLQHLYGYDRLPPVFPALRPGGGCGYL